MQTIHLRQVGHRKNLSAEPESLLAGRSVRGQRKGRQDPTVAYSAQVQRTPSTTGGATGQGQGQGSRPSLISLLE